MLGSDLAIINSYTDGLAAALVGPRRLRADLVTEARDSLMDAAMAHLDSGMRPGDAVRRAVDEFGHYRDIVPGYQAELAAAQGRRTALLMAIALPLLHLLAPLMWLGAPWQGSRPPVDGYYTLARNFDYLSLGASAIAVLALLGFGWGSRFVGDAVRYARAVGVSVLVFLALHGATGALVYGLSMYQWPGTLSWPPMLIGTAVNLSAFGYAALTAWRCVAAATPGLRRVSAA